jgi:hypothetical protein
MAWIESHQSLATHRKLYKLAALLNINRPQAIGHLHLIWWWALDNASDGSLQDIPSGVLEDVAGWSGEPGKLYNSLIESEWIDQDDLILHDWQEYAGKLVEQRALTKNQRSLGGRNRMAQLTPEKRKELATKAAAKRWDASTMPATPSINMPAICQQMPATVPNSTVPNHIKKDKKERYSLPDYINGNIWDDYMEMRKKKRATPTDRAIVLIIKDLKTFHEQGQDVNKVLELSIKNNWTGVFPLKDGKSGTHQTGTPKKYTPGPVYND